METVTDFTLLGPQITADGDRSHEVKRHLLLGRKAVANTLAARCEELAASRSSQSILKEIGPE